MIVINKNNSDNFMGFDWLDFDYLPDSKGFKFEIYPKESKNLIEESISFFYSLLGDLLNELLIRPFGVNVAWGNYCIDVWDIEKDTYNYSPLNKDEPTASYLSMLIDNNIEADYEGFCKCICWEKFLPIVLQCLMGNVAPYSLMFYEPENKFVFYFHQTGSFGIYYKELNTAVKRILKNIKEENLEIKHTNDDRVKLLIL